MIELEIKNWLQKGKDYEEISDDGNFRQICRVDSNEIEEYDKEKWKDGKLYFFETLHEVHEFLNSWDMEVKDEYYDEISLYPDLLINPNYDNRLTFEIWASYEY